MLLSLVLFGLGNGTAFVPLTSAALSGVAPEDAGAASGLVNVVQQLGGTLGVAVLVTVFGSASRHAAGDPLVVFTYAVDRAFLASAGFLVAALAMILLAVRATRSTTPPGEAVPR